MDASRWKKLTDLFTEALEVPPAERPAFLDAACAGDDALRHELASMLQHHVEAAIFFDDLEDSVFAGSRGDGRLASAGPDAADMWSLDAELDLIGHYRLLGRLGAGGMGVVYRARDTRLDRLVALKVLAPSLDADETARARFLNEARAVAALDHPNVCTIHDVGETEDGHLYLVMAHYEGQTLRARLDALARPASGADVVSGDAEETPGAASPGPGAMPLGEALTIAEQVGRALAQAHAAGIVHRDVKPGNIFLTDGDDVTGEEAGVKLLDFGLAHRADLGLTRTGTTMGTLAYISPEQAHGKAVTSASDVWALGVLLYEMLAGERPFAGISEAAVLHNVLYGTPLPLGDVRPDVPAPVVRLVRRCLHKNFHERPADGAAFVTALRKAAPSYVASDAAPPPVALASPPDHPPPDHPPPDRRPAAPASEAGTDVETDAAPEAEAAAGGWWGQRRGGALAALVLLVAVGVAVAYGTTSARRASGLPDAKFVALLAAPDSLAAASASTSGGLAPVVTAQHRRARAFQAGLVSSIEATLRPLEHRVPGFDLVPLDRLRRDAVTTPEDAHRLYGATLALTVHAARTEAGATRVRLTLADAATGRPLRRAEVTRAAPRAATLPDTLAHVLAHMLEVPRPVPQSTRALRPPAPGAYAFYTRGVGVLQGALNDTAGIDEAIGLFERALALDSAYAPAYARLGEAFLQRYSATDDARHVEQATTYSERALALDDDLATAYLTLGQIDRATGRPGSAIAQLRHALRLDSALVDAHVELARALEETGRLDEAEGIFRQAIAARPAFWGAYNNLAAYYYRHGRYEDAAEQFAYVTALAPQNPAGFSNLGAAHHMLGQTDAAIAALNRAIELRPAYYAPHVNLGSLYYQREEYDQAATYYEKALAIRDSDFGVWATLAGIYGEKGLDDPAKFRQSLRRAQAQARARLEVNPRDTDALAYMAQFHALLDDTTATRATLRTAIAQRPTETSTQLRIGITYERIGDRDRALAWIERALANGFPARYLLTYQSLQGIKDDPRFQRLIERYQTDESS